MKNEKKAGDEEYMKKMKGKKGDNPDEEKEEEENMAESCAKKSEDLTEDDLEKSLAKLTDYATEGNPVNRKQALLEKAMKDPLNDLEKSELVGLLGGGEPEPKETLADEIEKSMEPGDDMQKALDVSDFLGVNHAQSVEVSRKLADTIEKSDAIQHEFNMLLAGSTAKIGHLVKSLHTAIEALGEQPASKPRSQGAALEKSFAGATQPSGEDRLSKSEVLETINTLFRKSCDDGNDGFMEGVNLTIEASKYEQTGQLSPAVLNIIKQQRRSGR